MSRRFGVLQSPRSSYLVPKKAHSFPVSMSRPRVVHSFQRIPGCRNASTNKLENGNPTQTNLQGPPRREQVKKARIATKKGIRRMCQLKRKCAPDCGPTFQLDWRTARSGREASMRGIDGTKKRERLP